MIRSVSVFLALAITQSLVAQEKPAEPVSTLHQTADKTAAAWEALAKGLETKIARLLPCDPKSRAAVEEVSRASDARLVALFAYLKAAAAQAKSDTEAAKKVLAAQAALAGGWNTERLEAEQERNTIESQIVDLKESMRKRGSLADAEQVLVELARMVRDRGAQAEEQSGRRDILNALLGDMAVAYQDRQTAAEGEAASLQVEGARWSAYYVARLSRATTECTIVNPGAARKKQP
jgi:hypothetical protein